MLKKFIIAAMMALPLSAAAQEIIKEGIEGYVPSEENLARREQFRDSKFGIFIHWGVYSMIGHGEWVMQDEGIKYEDYAILPGGFYPSHFDAAEWVRNIKAAGAKYITITSRHHDGFSMFHSKASDYNIVDATPFKRDVLKELADECQKQGITLNFYYSLIDWGRGDFPVGESGRNCGKDPSEADYQHYLDFMCAQITELLTNYGPIGCIWFDGDWDKVSKPLPGQEVVVDFDWNYERIYRLIHELQPGCLVANNHHRINIPGEDVQLFERDAPGENTAGYSRTSFINQELPLETCQTMNKSWGFKFGDTNYKSAQTIIRSIIKTSGANANLLMNVAPQPDGRIPAESLRILAEVGKWMDENGETLHGTRSNMLKNQPWGSLTHKGNKIWLHVTSYPENGVITLPFTLKAKSVTPYKSNEALKWKKAKDSFTVQVPAGTDCSTDYIIEITLK